MRTYLPINVFDAALERFRWMFSEFPIVVVSVSGGKDSTVILNLALRVAEELGRLPLKVMFIDQEAEWQTVIDYVRTIMHDPRVEPYWLQVPIKLFNATSPLDPWLYCWKPGAEWIREKEPDSIHENVYGTDRFKPLFDKFLKFMFKGQKVANIGGVRAEESPARTLALTVAEKYPGVTWCKAINGKEEHYTFYPIYDWTYKDVWKAIHEQGWPYCPLYDYMYQYGIPVRAMRVSNVHHETAVHSLFFLQEVEPETWERITARISGINTAGVLGQRGFLQVPELPFMFSGWQEYRDYLLENLIVDPEIREKFARQFRATDKLVPEGYFDFDNPDEMYQFHVSLMLTNDYHSTKMGNFMVAHRKFWE